MRVSLYKHELDAVVALTTALVKEGLYCHAYDQKPSAETIGPEIFGRLVAILYAKGHYDWQSRRPISEPAERLPF